MRLLVWIFYIVFGAISIQAQSVLDATWKFINGDSIRYVYTDDIQAFAAPDKRANVVARLKSGDAVQILDLEATKSDTINDISAPWAKIRINSSNKNAYIWLGHLAIARVKKDAQTFMLGITGVSTVLSGENLKEETSTYALEVKVFDNLFSSKYWFADDNLSAGVYSMKVFSNLGLQGLQNIVRISSDSEACGIPSKHFYVGWDGNRFYALPSRVTIGDADVYSYSENFIFPSEKGGKPNVILKITEEYEGEGDGSPMKLVKREKQEFIWDATGRRISK